MENDFTTDCTRFLLLGDLAKRLKVRPHRIAYLLQSQQIAEPTLRLGGRRVFLPADVERVAMALQKKRTNDE